MYLFVEFFQKPYRAHFGVCCLDFSAMSHISCPRYERYAILLGPKWYQECEVPSTQQEFVALRKPCYNAPLPCTELHTVLRLEVVVD